jgi:hypothetical protein
VLNSAEGGGADPDNSAGDPDSAAGAAACVSSVEGAGTVEHTKVPKLRSFNEAEEGTNRPPRRQALLGVLSISLLYVRHASRVPGFQNIQVDMIPDIDIHRCAW